MVQAYTIILVEMADGYLLINRAKKPFQGMWNGLGGKVEAGETPLQGAARELQEESGLLGQLTEKGLVHWHEDGQLVGELYLVHAKVAGEFGAPKMTREGVLACWPLAWLTAPTNMGLVPDLKAMLAPLLGEAGTYRSDFESGRLVSFEAVDD